MKSREITVGTRSSLLALTQAHKFLVELQAISKTDYSELLHSKTQLILTEGDLKQGTQDAGKLTKKAWIREIEDALVDGRIDVAIHSGKDIPADIHEDTKLLPILRREYPFDIFIGKIDENGNRKKFSSLDADALIGTASLRRRLFSQRINPNFKIVEHRGNVPTRLTKLDESESLSGIILAEASLKRLGFNIEYETLEN